MSFKWNVVSLLYVDKHFKRWLLTNVEDINYVGEYFTFHINCYT